MTAQPDRPLFIRELIRRAHAELLQSRDERERAGLPPIFEVQSLTIEVNFVATESREIEGGIDFRVITAGGQKHFEQQQVHKLTLALGAVAGASSGDEFSDLDRHASRFMPRDQGS